MSLVRHRGQHREQDAASGGNRSPTKLPARLVGFALCLGASAFAVWTAVVIGQHWRQPNYAMPMTVVVIAALCAVLTATGAGMATRRGDMARSWLTVLTTLLFLWGFLTIFSIGIGLLIAAVGLLVVRVRLPAVHPVGHLNVGIGAGLLLALGLVPLTALAISGPVVECTAGGVQSSVPMWSWFSPASGRSSSGGNSLNAHGEESPSGTQRTTGRVTVGGTTYAYTCTDNHLTRFTTG